MIFGGKMGFLRLGTRKDEKIYIGHDIAIKTVKDEKGRINLEINAPDSLFIARASILTDEQIDFRERVIDENNRNHKLK